MMAHVNPAHWIARIMITWSIVTGCMAAISTPWHFYLLRFLLVKRQKIYVILLKVN
jgi:hypothetical protein